MVAPTAAHSLLWHPPDSLMYPWGAVRADAYHLGVTATLEVEHTCMPKSGRRAVTAVGFCAAVIQSHTSNLQFTPTAADGFTALQTCVVDLIETPGSPLCKHATTTPPPPETSPTTTQENVPLKLLQLSRFDWLADICPPTTQTQCHIPPFPTVTPPPRGAAPYPPSCPPHPPTHTHTSPPTCRAPAVLVITNQCPAGIK